MVILEKEINNTINELDNILFSFSDKELNTVPAEGSWTAGQTTDHIIKALTDIPGLFNGPTQPVTRPADEKVPAIDGLFLDFTKKMISPAFIEPGAGPFEKEVQLKTVSKLKQDLLDGSKMNLEVECTAFEVPGFGKFTRREWLEFYLVHTQRHTQQIKNIFRTLQQNTNGSN